MNVKKQTRRTILQISGLIVLMLQSLALQACNETNNPAIPENEPRQHTVTPSSFSCRQARPSENWNLDSAPNGLYYWTETTKESPYNIARWTVPFTTPGFYQVQVYIPRLHKFSKRRPLFYTGRRQSALNHRQSGRIFRQLAFFRHLLF